MQLMDAGKLAVQSFRRIIKWLEADRRAKAAVVSFRKPASATAIAYFERKTKLKLPEAVKAIYRLHDGQDEEAANARLDGETIESGIFPSIDGRGDLPFLLIPLKEMQAGLKHKMPGWREGWVPFGDNYGGDQMVIDLASPEAKKRGRVLQFNHEYGVAAVVAPSFEQYLKSIAEGLRKKQIVWDDETGLSYSKGVDWDELVEKGKVEYQPEPEEVKADDGREKSGLVGKWKVLEMQCPPGGYSAMAGWTDDVLEFTKKGDYLVKVPKGGLRRGGRYRYKLFGKNKPGWIDIFDAKFRDIRCCGIYEVSRDELTICSGQLHEPRPRSLKRTGKAIRYRMKRLRI